MHLSSALIIETNNLMSASGRHSEKLEDLVTRSLIRLLSHLKKQSFSIERLAEIVVTHFGLSEACLNEIRAQTQIQVSFLKLPQGTGYYAAKNEGFKQTRSSIVVFADADCIPDQDWLENLIEPFVQSDSVQAVSGRTCYPSTLPGIAGTTIDFMYFQNRGEPHRTLNFYANNIAFRREVFESYAYASDSDFYRGNCQTLGLKMQKDKVEILFKPQARTTHRFPDSISDFFKLRFHRGQDMVELTPHLMAHHLSPFWAKALGWRPLGPLIIFVTRLYFSLRSIGRQDMPQLNWGRTIACVGWILGINALDFCGLVARCANFSIVGESLKSLSYHREYSEDLT